MQSRPSPLRARLWLIVDGAIDDRRLQAVFAQIRPSIAAAEGLVGLIERDHTGRDDRRRLARLAWIQAQIQGLAVPLWVNRRVDLAIAIQAAGVQLTSRSPATERIRRAFPGLGVARSCHSHEEVVEASEAGADFILISPIFDPFSKAPERPAIGLESLEKIAGLGKTPLIALGGVGADRLNDLTRVGVAGFATIGGVFHSADPATAITAYITHLCDEMRSVAPDRSPPTREAS